MAGFFLDGNVPVVDPTLIIPIPFSIPAEKEVERDEELVGEMLFARLAGLHEIADLVSDLVCNGLARLAVRADGGNDDRRVLVAEAGTAVVAWSEGVDLAYNALQSEIPQLVADDADFRLGDRTRDVRDDALDGAAHVCAEIRKLVTRGAFRLVVRPDA